jgi:hypothetical protein
MTTKFGDSPETYALALPVGRQLIAESDRLVTDGLEPGTDDA